MKVFYFTALFLTLTIGLQAQYQTPFHIKEDNIKLDQTFRLKSIYHHASVNGPIPRLFRRLDITDTIQTQQEPLHISSTLHQYQRVTPHAKNYLIQQATSSVLSNSNSNKTTYSYQPKKIRWKYLNDISPLNKDIYMEPVWGLVPNITYRPSLLSLAIMTNNAYSDVDNTTDWLDIGEPWNLNSSFGWKSDGIRGHVFGNEDNSLLVISYKGTSAGLWTGGPTGENDKINDNMLFSCCCARISRSWTPVCDCYQGNEYLCESECLEKSIANAELYYDHALEIYLDLTNRYKNATIWLTGHSLGGALASLVGQTFGIPTVTFEAPGDQLASSRLHLPYVPSMPLWQIGHTGDPIFVGLCTGPSSSCWYGGFAMESRCHTGKICTWDTVNDNGWRVDIRTHRIKDVIENILKKPKEFPLPECKEEDSNCIDCGLWKYFDIRDDTNETTSTTITTTTTAIATETNEPPDNPWY